LSSNDTHEVQNDDKNCARSVLVVERHP